MRNLIVIALAIAAAACGGTSSGLSAEEARSVGDAIAGAMPQQGAAGSHDFTLSGSVNKTYQCPGGGSLSVSGSLSINCPTFYTCSTSGSLSVAATACTTSSGVEIDGKLTSTVSGSGVILTETVTGTLAVTAPGGTTTTCSVNATISGGKVSGSICGVTL